MNECELSLNADKALRAQLNRRVTFHICPVTRSDCHEHDCESKSKPMIAISWSGLPVYGARLIRAGIKRLGQPVAVIATKPEIPIKGMEEILGQKIHWIDGSDVYSWEQLYLPVPDIFFQAGWFVPSFNNLGKEVKCNGGKVICLIDNYWENNLRQWLGAVYFRLVYKRWFSAYWVAGKSGKRLLRFFGVSSSRIYQGLYGADPQCFSPGPTLTQRPKQLIYVGRFIPEKGISTLAKAFKIFHSNFPEWELIAYGVGECKSLLENSPGITVHQFAQPPQIAEALKRSRFLVLPSLVDHWPLVVAEATLVGCGLILSDKVGNCVDLLNQKNGFVFPAKSEKELSVRLKKAANLSDSQLDEMYGESKRLGSLFDPEHWGVTFKKIIAHVWD